MFIKNPGNWRFYCFWHINTCKDPRQCWTEL